MNNKIIPTSKDISGKVFGMLRVIKKHHLKIKGVIMWKCICECGTIKLISKSNLNNGSTVSCGCKRESQFKIKGIKSCAYKHGMRNTPEYEAWRAMKKRCFLENNQSFIHYGKRGITVCSAWEKSFEAFISDMGKRPTNNHSLDRINNNGNYEPKNCRWATTKEQCNNKRNNVVLDINGEALNISQWAERTKQPAARLYKRKESGFVGLEIITGKKL